MKYQTSINEKTLSFIGLPILICILVLALLIITTTLGIAYLINRQFGYLTGLALAYTVSFAVNIYLPIYVRRELIKFAETSVILFDLPSPKVKAWWNQEFSILYSRKKWWISLMTVGIGGPTLLVYQTQWWKWPFPWFSSRLIEISVFAAILILVYFGNEFTTVLVGLPRLISHLGKLPTKKPMYLDPQIGLPAIGSLMFKVALMATIDYSFFLTGAIESSPFGTTLGSGVLAVFAFFGIMIVSFFVLSMYNLHLAMSEHKYAQIRIIAVHLWQAVQLLDSQPTKTNLEQTLSLQQIYDSLCNIAEWPFSRNELIGLLTAVASPIFITFINVIITKVIA